MPAGLNPIDPVVQIIHHINHEVESWLPVQISRKYFTAISSNVNLELSVVATVNAFMDNIESIAMGKSVRIARISALPGHLVNQIAAGEVIERPSSVVKELIENAIDSGASRIDIELEGGGCERILIRDNGSGIHPDDMELAVKRHSTSKISSQDDLEAIASLGFRGEALSSIASVSDFSLTSRIAAVEQGRHLVFDPYTSKYEISPAAHQQGSTVVVSKLFQAIPARRKFLKSQRTEFLHIQDIVRRFVLSRLDIAFYFHHNGRLLLGCPAVTGDSAGSRLKEVMGSRFLAHNWQIDSQVNGMRLWGWLGNEMTARSQSDRQYLYLNQRIIRDRHINHAVRQALQEIIADSRYPSYILYLALDPAEVDVNVHPTKQEVRFKHARDVHDFIYAALKEAMNQSNLDNDMNESPSQGVIHDTSKPAYSDQHGPFDLAELKAVYAVNTDTASRDRENQTPMGRPLAMIHDHFLISLHECGARVADLKAMMHYYIFNSMQKDYRKSQVKHRPLLVPLMLTLAHPEFDRLLERKTFLQAMGIEISQSGPTTLSIRSIPSILPGLDILRLLKDFSEIKDADESVYENSLLTLIAELGSEASNGMTITDATHQLQKMTHLDLPFGEPGYPGLWKTMTRQDLQDLLDVRKTPN